MSNPAAPWTDPQPGDVCDPGDYRRRTVTKVIYCGPLPRLWEPHEDRRPGDWVDAVEYESLGRPRRCNGDTWATWCRRMVKAGGRYLRDGVDAVQRAAERFAELRRDEVYAARLEGRTDG